jgi:hypothetical protein
LGRTQSDERHTVFPFAALLLWDRDHRGIRRQRGGLPGPGRGCRGSRRRGGRCNGIVGDDEGNTGNLMADFAVPFPVATEVRDGGAPLHRSSAFGAHLIGLPVATSSLDLEEEIAILGGFRAAWTSAKADDEVGDVLMFVTIVFVADNESEVLVVGGETLDVGILLEEVDGCGFET